MSANFWKGSQCASWMLDEAVLDRAKAKDASFLSADNQTALTYLFADVIRSLGDELKLRQQVVATATIYFKRFYHKNSWTSIQPYLMAQTCIYLATKVEECGPIQARRVQAVGGKIVRASLLLRPQSPPPRSVILSPLRRTAVALYVRGSECYRLANLWLRLPGHVPLSPDSPLPRLATLE
mmetsp:Transcript_6776/g.17455  ORF Transcript_6776/g.17455 Transcript_6776/m.17455 type:complete len:181 (+) Transcript_6776:258-800(+)